MLKLVKTRPSSFESFVVIQSTYKCIYFFSLYMQTCDILFISVIISPLLIKQWRALIKCYMLKKYSKFNNIIFCDREENCREREKSNKINWIQFYTSMSFVLLTKEIKYIAYIANYFYHYIYYRSQKVYEKFSKFCVSIRLVGNQWDENWNFLFSFVKVFVHRKVARRG